SKVKIPAGKSVKVTLSFKEPKAGKATAFPLYSGYVIATPSSKGGVAVSVPYTGIKGDISKVPIMDTDTGFPTMGYLNSTHDFNEIPKGFTFDLKKDTPASPPTPPTARSKFAGFMFSNSNGGAFGKRGRDANHDEEGNMIFDLWSWKGQVVTTATV
ncbi:hypothetical protein CPC16_007171, partial [Podila verticillata]